MPSAYVVALIGALQLALLYTLVAGLRRRRGEDHRERGVAGGHCTAASQRLVQRLLAEREMERARIARALHDELGSNLTAVIMDIAAARQQMKDLPPSATLARAIEVLQATVNWKRSMVQDLRPPVLDTLGLSTAIESHAADQAERTGIAIETHLTDPLPPLKAGSPIIPFRIAQEALLNAARHAKASLIEVRLEHEGPSIRVEVIDNGIGFDPNAIPPDAACYGLLIMRELALQAGGTLTIGRGHDGRGTRIQATLPCVDVEGVDKR